MKDIILFGIQGSGKGTQAKLLVDALPDRFSYFAMGDVLRTLTTTDNALGVHLKNRMKAGDLIKDEVMNALFEAYVHTVLHDEKYMLLDGYPRTVPQIEGAHTLIQEHEREMLGIQFVIPDTVALERMKGRGRADDTPEAMQHRIDQFYANTQPMIDRFENNATLIKIDATKSIEEIHQNVVEIIKK